MLDKRPDGLHEIQSLVQTIDLHDTLRFEARREGIVVEVDDPLIPSGPENLVWRAAAALPQPASGPRGVRIRIQKSIPAGAGLGGGSSDAAATLIALRRLWGLALDDEALVACAARLGSDVPFFLQGGTALLMGTGTDVRPLPDLQGYEFLILFPGANLSTREVYAGTSASLTSALKISSMPAFEPTLEGNLRREVETWVSAGNDLEPFARSLCPLIGDLEDRLRGAGAVVAAMTGSGSAVFGIFRDGAAIDKALTEARAAGIVAVRSVPLTGEEYRRRVGLL